MNFSLACVRKKMIHIIHMVAVCIGNKGFERVNDCAKWFT